MFRRRWHPSSLVSVVPQAVVTKESVRSLIVLEVSIRAAEGAYRGETSLHVLLVHG